jgi:biopolymer transport protein ExbB/TolQ
MASPPTPSRPPVGLLVAITTLLGVLVLGMLIAGILALRWVPEAMSLLREMNQELKATRLATQELRAEVDRMQAVAASASAQVAERQREAARALLVRARETQEKMAGISKRRASIPERVPTNPLAKLDTVIELNKIMADEILILNRQLADSLEDMADVVEPIPIQEKRTPP